MLSRSDRQATGRAVLRSPDHLRLPCAEGRTDLPRLAEETAVHCEIDRQSLPNDRRLAQFVSLCRPARPDLIITQQRALALGLDASAPMAVRLPEAIDADKIFNLVAERKSHALAEASAASAAAVAAIRLVKLSR